jgi:adenylyl-sulfate kinase
MTVHPPRERGVTIWLTGLSGAGKSTLAEALGARLVALGRRVEVLDGDAVRTHLSKGLGFSREDRDTNVRRIGYVAHLLTRNGVFVITAAISPYRETRAWCRDTIGDFVEVYLDVPLAVCAARDVKGLYKRAEAGEIPAFTGVSDPYEAPESPELALPTHTLSVEACVARIVERLADLGYLPPSAPPPLLHRLGVRAPMNAPVPSTAAPFLPRFSDPADIDEFVDTLARFERGEISPEVFRRYRLARGVYGQRQEGAQMLRVKIPQGVLSSAQLRTLGDVAARWGHGYGHVTTRQNIQFHFVPMTEVEGALRVLDTTGLTTREACGNTVRNVTADPLAGVRDHGTFDVTPYGEAITRFFLRQGWANSLPRKFKIALGYAPGDTALTAIHDVGLVARVRDGQRGFTVRIAGGLSTSPQNAAALPRVSPRVRAPRRVRRRGARLRPHGQPRQQAPRAAQVRAAQARARALPRHPRGGARRGAGPRRPPPRPLRGHPRADPAAPVPSPPTPRAAPAPGPGYLRWRASNALAQDQAGYHAVVVRLPLGRITAAQFDALADIAERFSEGALRLAVDQNLLLRFVPTGRLGALYAALDAAGLGAPDARTVADVTTCPGAETCNLAVTASRQVGAAITARLESDPPSPTPSWPPATRR